MRFAHISDLHIGKRVNDFSMIEDQTYILKQILDYIAELNIDTLFIAGDVYDKQLPSTEAVVLCDWFITELYDLGIDVFIISGNHDSAERLSFGSKIINTGRIHIAPAFSGKMQHMEVTDEYGTVNIYMMPFIRQSKVREFYPDADIQSITDAMKTVIDNSDIDPDARNILISHQFVTGAATSESESVVVGDLDNIDASVFDVFDYVALGHIHKAQFIGRESLRYCGTPLKYSFSECNDEKSMTIVEMDKEGQTCISAVALKPLHDMRVIKGTYDLITSRAFYKDFNTDDYFRVILTDEEDIPDVIGKLRSIYPNIMHVEYDNTRTRANNQVVSSEIHKEKTPIELFDEFYQIQNNKEMSQEQKEYTEKLIKKIWNNA